MNKYYVYAYLRKDLTPYYIGKGKGGRAYAKHIGTNPPSDKERIVFLHKDLDEAYAYTLEALLIKMFGRKDNGTGILRNLTDGGEGVHGSTESGKKISKLLKSKGIKPPWCLPGYTGNRGYVMTTEQKQAKSEAMKLIIAPRSICVHCGIESLKRHISRWHNDNCKWAHK